MRRVVADPLPQQHCRVLPPENLPLDTSSHVILEFYAFGEISGTFIYSLCTLAPIPTYGFPGILALVGTIDSDWFLVLAQDWSPE